MTDKIQCDKCGQFVTFEREGQYELLHVSCACTGRYVKVKTALPEGWE